MILEERTATNLLATIFVTTMLKTVKMTNTSCNIVRVIYLMGNQSLVYYPWFKIKHPQSQQLCSEVNRITVETNIEKLKEQKS